MPLLIASNLSCVRGERILFENLCFSLSEGEVVYLQGENGSGKSSLLRILSGLVRPNDGNLMYKGKALDINQHQLAQDLIYVSHKPSINGTMTAVENIQFWTVLQGIQITQSDIDNVLMALGLAGCEDIPISQLSAGQQRRVALSKLWFKTDAKIWILDEPYTALDYGSIETLNDYISNFVKNEGAVVLTSHQAPSIVGPLTHLTLEYQF